MNIAELIEALLKFPPHLQVRIIHDVDSGPISSKVAEVQFGRVADQAQLDQPWTLPSEHGPQVVEVHCAC